MIAENYVGLPIEWEAASSTASKELIESFVQSDLNEKT